MRRRQAADRALCRVVVEEDARVVDPIPEKRTGCVFVDRYHVEVLRSPAQTRHALSYVLNNWRKHGDHRDDAMRGWRVDPFSTGFTFDGWREGLHLDR